MDLRKAVEDRIDFVVSTAMLVFSTQNLLDSSQLCTM